MIKTALTFVLLFVITSTFAQKKGFVQGLVLDNEADKEPLAYSTITIKNTQKKLETDNNGIFHVVLDSGTYYFEFTFAGYQKINLPVVVKSGEVTTLKNVILKALQLKSIALHTSKNNTDLLQYHN
ncbi:MAG TPA: hypothetical protein DDZ39_03735 [Flavobacteriaceae bacterium]|jgi:hypothetical protein|nr:hypothetical protein [Flavobacteriaceae bacterium]HBS12734.1 hypothetical protein [Flavobacteriaceae bacterium]